MASYLVTGGAGYVGAHTCVCLAEAGHDVVVLDNLSNSSPVAVTRVEELTGAAVTLVEGDLRQRSDIDAVFRDHDVAGVVHLAGLKSVGASAMQPRAYYENNVAGTINLVGAMDDAGVRDIVFSSTATVYGQPDPVPATEASRIDPLSPYARTKRFAEEILRDHAEANPQWRVWSLRYFNPVGAHPSGRIGEHSDGIPTNLMPAAMQVAAGQRSALTVFGADYDTPDGTGIRDYLHVMDLAAAHVAAMAAIDRVDRWRAVNLGTGMGRSVLEVIEAVERAIGRPLPYEIGARRPGDVAILCADPSLAHDLLDWRATRSLDDMCGDHWRWQQQNPHGYDR